ncbi:MAG TPA: right-handed parallel beta-helix repeat-containing protein [Solirubrobacteraceae bacterium]|jgi:hypothetical protein
MRSGFVAVITAAMLACACAQSTAVSRSSQLFVSPKGNDAWAGSLKRPLRTLQRAVDRARPGTTVYVRGGRYAGFLMASSGRPGAPITIKAYSPRSRPVLRPAGASTEVVELRRVHDVVLQGMTVTEAPKQWGAGVRINDSSAIRIARMTLLRNHSYGIKVKGSSDVLVTQNRMTRNETGIEISGGGEGVVISDNDIYRNDHLIVNDATPGNDRGANGTVFHKTTGHIRVTGNRIWGNRGPSHDWVNDGGAFEVYAASNLEISENVVWDNENVMETGTDGSAPCAHNRFYRNVAYAGGQLPSGGMILRCASDMLVANNTLAGIDRFAFDVKANDARYGGSVEGLRIVNNVASSPDRVYSIDSALPATVQIDRNLAFNPTGSWLAYVSGHGNTRDLAVFSTWSGYERSGVTGDPLFVDPAGRDYRLSPGSPAADRGMSVPGVTDGSRGPAPDLGRWEMG